MIGSLQAREWTQLRDKFYKIKKVLRSEASDEKNEIFQTGGGTKKKKTPLVDRHPIFLELAALMYTSIHGLNSMPGDDDFEAKTTNAETTNAETTNATEQVRRSPDLFGFDEGELNNADFVASGSVLARQPQQEVQTVQKVEIDGQIMEIVQCDDIEIVEHASITPELKFDSTSADEASVKIGIPSTSGVRATSATKRKIIKPEVSTDQAPPRTTLVRNPLALRRPAPKPLQTAAKYTPAYNTMRDEDFEDRAAKRQKLFDAEMVERQEHILTQQVKQKLLHEQIATNREAFREKTAAERAHRSEQHAEHVVNLKILQIEMKLKKYQLLAAQKKHRQEASSSDEDPTDDEAENADDVDFNCFPNSQQNSPTGSIL